MDGIYFCIESMQNYQVTTLKAHETSYLGPEILQDIFKLFLLYEFDEFHTNATYVRIYVHSLL